MFPDPRDSRPTGHMLHSGLVGAETYEFMGGKGFKLCLLLIFSLIHVSSMFQSMVCDNLLLCHLLLVSYMVLLGFVYVGDCCLFVGSCMWIVACFKYCCVVLYDFIGCFSALLP